MSLRLLLVASLAASPIASFAEGCNSLDGLEWLLGDWKSTDGNNVTIESWERISPLTFEGFAEVRSVADDSLKSRETLRLVQMSGEVFYVAKVAHNEHPIGFRLIDCPEGSAVFENAEHDFPTRIAYRQAGEKELIARVSGADGKGFEVNYHRVPVSRFPEGGDLLFSSNRDGNMEIYLLPASSLKWINLTNHPSGDNWPVWSPDGSRIAFQSRRNGKFDIFVMDASGSNLRQLTDNIEHDYLPSWTSDGSQITFVSWRLEEGDEDRANHIYIMNADGSGQRRLLPQSPGTSATVQWSPDGTRMVRTQKRGDRDPDLFLADVKGLAIRQLTDDAASNASPAFSPDGSQVAFYSDDGSVSRIEIIGTDGHGRRTVVGEGKNYHPRWSPDGCWLVYSAIVDPESGEDIDVRAIRADGSGESLTLVTGPGRESEASWWPGPGTTNLVCR